VNDTQRGVRQHFALHRGDEFFAAGLASDFQRLGQGIKRDDIGLAPGPFDIGGS
jgi:hypothetical protein